MKGMNNKLLKINLTDQSILEKEISDEILEKYIGGRGLGVKLLIDNIPPSVDPLSPENLLIFTIGPFSATTIPTNIHNSACLILISITNHFI